MNIHTPHPLLPPPLLQMLMAQSAANLEDVRFEAASIAARILLEQVSPPCQNDCWLLEWSSEFMWREVVALEGSSGSGGKW